ncbi:MAG: beta-Ig-H3/fasciclin [Flavobacteriaceae bacterium]|nr:beta-Ig-H3/fasciclin [Flavobacteriaceae bacterium]
MKNLRRLSLLSFVMLLFVSAGTMAQNKMMKEKTKMVGGAEMYPSKNIVQNAVNSKDHTTLVAAVKAAGLVDVLQSKGPFTVFAPTNAAFEKLPDGTVATLLKPENKESLKKVLTYHVVQGDYKAADIVKMIKKSKGKATFKTVSGGMLYATLDGDKVMLWDENGSKAMVTIADVNQSNGVIHVINAVVLPK